jgi:hypothetical protein
MSFGCGFLKGIQSASAWERAEVSAHKAAVNEVPPSLRTLRHTHTPAGVEAYRISSFRSVNPEMQYPRRADLDVEFRQIQFRCDITVTEALANQTINLAQHSHFFPEDTH